MINVISFSAVFFVLLAFITLQTGSTLWFSINIAFIGISLIPIIPISYGFCVELTYPIPEPMSNGMMILPSQIFGAILGAVASIICESTINEKKPMDQNGPLICIGMFAFSALIGAISSLFIKEELRRLKPTKAES